MTSRQGLPAALRFCQSARKPRLQGKEDQEARTRFRASRSRSLRVAAGDKGPQARRASDGRRGRGRGRRSGRRRGADVDEAHGRRRGEQWTGGQCCAARGGQACSRRAAELRVRSALRLNSGSEV